MHNRKDKKILLAKDVDIFYDCMNKTLMNGHKISVPLSVEKRNENVVRNK